MHLLKRGLLNPPTTNPPTTGQPTTDHLLTHQPTHRPPTHQRIDAIIRFKRLSNMFTLQSTNTAVKT